MKQLLKFYLFFLPFFCFFSCSEDDEIANNERIVTIKADGTTSSNAKVTIIDDKNLYIDDLKYSVVEGHMEITGYDSYFSGVVAPYSKVKFNNQSYDVLAIGQKAFYNSPKVTSVDIPMGFKSLEWEAFSHCENLISVKLPPSLLVIDGYSFCDCYNLPSIDIPEGVEKIGWMALAGCEKITTISFPSTIKIIDGYALPFSSLETLYFYSKEPPVYTTDDIRFLCATIYVPKGCKYAYENSVWNRSEIKEMN